MLSCVDLHMHSTASDGTDSPEALYDNLKKAKIRIFALTDHDTVGGVKTMAELCKNDPEMLFIPGIEFSCKTKIKKCHILGLGIDPENPYLLGLIKKGVQLRQKKLENRLVFLREKHGIIFAPEVVEKFRNMDTVGKPHLAQEIIKMEKAENVSQAIALYLKNCDKGDEKLDAMEAISVIKMAGGIPVWAHPLGGEGEKRLTEEEVEAQIDLLSSFGILGLECYYSRYTINETKGLLEKAKERKLLVSGGSDYHGKVKTISLGELSAQGLQVTKEDLSVLESLMR